MSQAPDSGRLFQEDLRSEPFWMLIACILVNRTHWRQAKPVLERLRAKCEGAAELKALPLEELISDIRSLGFYNRRASTIRRFCADWLNHEPTSDVDVARMAGCGMYAVQSYRIFVQNLSPEGEVTDHKLQWYMENRMEYMR